MSSGVRVVPFAQLHIYTVLGQRYDVRYDFIPICFVRGSCFINVIYIYLRILVFNTISLSDILVA